MSHVAKTPPEPGGLTEFIAARLDEDEARAQYATTRDTPDWGGWWLGHYQHYIRHDPAAVLRSVEADRKILVLHSEELYRCRVCVIPDPYDVDYRAHYPCPTLRALGSTWADHEGYRSEWAYQGEEWP